MSIFKESMDAAKAILTGLKTTGHHTLMRPVGELNGIEEHP